MDDLWFDLEHMNPQDFMKDTYTYFCKLVRQGLRKRHGEITPSYAFFRTEEVVFPKKDSEMCLVVQVPRLTVCYLRPVEPSPETGRTAVGFAYCNSVDNPNKWFGRALAFKRAITALVGREDNQENFIREYTELAYFLDLIGCPSNVKASVIYSSDFKVTDRRVLAGNELPELELP